MSRQRVGKLAQTVLADAVTDAGKIDIEHPLVMEWLATHDVHELPDVGAPHKQQPPKSAQAVRSPPASKPSPVQTRAGSYAIEQLEDLTVREVVMKYGSIDGFKRYVESLKHIADYKYRELRVLQQRGDLIERDKVSGQVFPLIDVAFSRLVSDVPDSVSKMVIARAESGGPETLRDVQQLIRDANSRVLKNVKTSLEKLEFLNNAN